MITAKRTQTFFQTFNLFPITNFLHTSSPQSVLNLSGLWKCRRPPNQLHNCVPVFPVPTLLFPTYANTRSTSLTDHLITHSGGWLFTLHEQLLMISGDCTHNFNSLFVSSWEAEGSTFQVLLLSKREATS